jgi:hypothetical protein
MLDDTLFPGQRWLTPSLRKDMGSENRCCLFQQLTYDNSDDSRVCSLEASSRRISCAKSDIGVGWIKVITQNGASQWVELLLLHRWAFRNFFQIKSILLR